ALDLLDRRLHHHKIVDAIGRQIKRRIGQRARRQAGQHAIRDVALRETEAGRAQPVHVHPQSGVVPYLDLPNVDRARHLFDRLAQPAGEKLPTLEVRVLHLYVDRGRQAEVQYLGDDVGALEIEGRSWKLGWDLFTDRPLILRDRAVRSLERDQD